jgi:hypothetical protein
MQIMPYKLTVSIIFALSLIYNGSSSARSGNSSSCITDTEWRDSGWLPDTIKNNTGSKLARVHLDDNKILINGQPYNPRPFQRLLSEWKSISPSPWIYLSYSKSTACDHLRKTKKIIDSRINCNKEVCLRKEN